jgi:hypothetical protein
VKLWGVLVIAACTQSTAMNVVGTVTDTWITPTGKVTRARDVSASTFQAFVLGSDGAYVAHPEVAVHGGSDGTFEIADVPIGPYLLVENGDYWSTETASEIVRTYTWVGRPDAVPATQTTWLGLSGSDLSAWNPNDTLLADCWGNGTELEVSSLLSIGSGATSLDGAIEWNELPVNDMPLTDFAYSFGPTSQPYLMNADKGDALVVSHDTASSIGSTTIARTLTQIMNAPGVDQIDAGSAMTGGSFVDVPMTSQIELAIDPSEFEAEFGSGSVESYSIDLIATPGASSDGLMGPLLVEIQGSGDRVDETFPYGDPFDPVWPQFVNAYYTFQQDDLSPVVNCYEQIQATASYGFHPSSPVTAVTLNGTAIDQRQVAPVVWDGTSPLTFTVTLPDGATGFTISLIDDTAVAESFFSIDGSTFAIPPQVFVAGDSYEMQIGVQTSATAGSLVLTDGFTVGSAQPK